MSFLTDLKVDWTKALSFLLILTFVSVIIVTTFLVPTVRDYRKQSSIYDVENSSYKKVKEKYGAATSELKKFKEENAPLISDLDNKLNEQSLRKMALRSFKSFELDPDEEQQEDEQDAKDGFSHKDYKCTASMSEPVAMFEFFEELKRLGNVVKLRTPLVLTSTGEGVLLGFALRVYTIDKTSHNVEEKHSVAAH